MYTVVKRRLCCDVSIYAIAPDFGASWIEFGIAQFFADLEGVLFSYVDTRLIEGYYK